jgi:hypothetical protein
MSKKIPENLEKKELTHNTYIVGQCVKFIGVLKDPDPIVSAVSLERVVADNNYVGIIIEVKPNHPAWDYPLLISFGERHMGAEYHEVENLG